MDKRWKVVKAFRENQPDFYLIYEGAKTFGGDPVASCDTQINAEQIVFDHNNRLAS